MHTKKFKSGNSLAVRIPHALAAFFSGNDFKIYQKNNRVIIEKGHRTWDEIFAKCYNPDFPDKEPMNFSNREAL